MLPTPTKSCPLPERLDNSALHLQVGGDVAIRGRYAGVSEVVADDGEVDASLEERDGAAVPKDVRRGRGPAENGVGAGRLANVFP